MSIVGDTMKDMGIGLEDVKNFGLSEKEKLYWEGKRPLDNKMSTREFKEFIGVTLLRVQKVLEGKNHDYAKQDYPLSNFEKAENFGIDRLTGLALRMSDKMARLETYCRKGELKSHDDGLTDIFYDFIGYSIIALAMLEEEKYD